VRSAAIAFLLLLSGCGTLSRQEDTVTAPPAASPPPQAAPARGAYYKDDGPGANPPPDLAAISDAVPKLETPHRFANRPYQVFGKDYVPLAYSAPNAAPFRQTGIGSWYGRRFHGAPTSSGEPYDMYAMTAAHPTLPIPSYARVTNLANGRGVVVRINDRGPFHADRIIDLSYTAAWKLGYADAGSARVEVEAVLSGKAEPVQEAKAEVKGDGRGIFLQLGAFSARESAENFRARVYRELAWLSEAIHVVAGGALFRLQLGPYRTQDDARAIADRIQSELSLRPLVVAR
jgi:rare lipoprotein A